MKYRICQRIAAVCSAIVIVELSVQLASTSSLRTANRPESLDEINFICPKENGDFAHELFCEKFYHCVKGVAQLKSCPSFEYLFNDFENGCDYSYNVHCFDRIRPDGAAPTVLPPPTTTTPTPTTSPRPTTTPTPTTSPRPTTTPTPTTTTSRTNPTTIATSPPTITIHTTPFPPDIFNCTVNGAFPHPRYCEMYFDCWEGRAVLLSCPNHTLFDINYAGCAPPDEVDCGDRISPFVRMS